MDKNLDSLNGELESRLTELSEMEDMTNEGYDIGVTNLGKIHEMIVEEKKIELERDRIIYDKKQAQFDRIARASVDVLLGVAPMILTGLYFNRGMKFEETGSYQCKTLMNIIKNIKPFRK